MALRNRKLLCCTTTLEGFIGCSSRLYRSNPRVDLKKLRPMILRRIEIRAKEYPLKPMVPVANEVIKARTLLINGVSALIHAIPIWACKYCSEIYIGEEGHTIRTCGGYKCRAKAQVHKWVQGGLNDILVPVETFHLQQMFQNVIRHQERFDYNHIPAVVGLSLQAGASSNYEHLYSNDLELARVGAESISTQDLRFIAIETLKSWELLRSNVQKLLMVYPAKVCKYCSEVHVGPSGHKARLCGVFKYENWRGKHFWMKAEVDDLLPPKIGWFRRPQDPPVLVDEGRAFYGHAPAVVNLCTKAGAVTPSKYLCMMKMQGLSAPLRFKPQE